VKKNPVAKKTKPPKSVSRVAVFWSKVDKSGECWIWTGTRLPTGYGRFYDGEKMVNAHRHALLLSGVRIHKNELACHRCDNPPCVRPSHLFVGTQRENILDAMSKGRHVAPNRGKTICASGHPFTDENTKFRVRSGKIERACRECYRIDKKNRRSRAKAI